MKAESSLILILSNSHALGGKFGRPPTQDVWQDDLEITLNNQLFYKLHL